MEISDIISIIAVGIAFGSLLVALLSLLNSRKAIRLAEAEHSERKLPVKAYLIDCFAFRDGDDSCCAFAISYTNQSSTSKSFISLELEIEFYYDEGVFGKAILPLAKGIDPLRMSKQYKQLEAPLNLLPGETVSGWTAFSLPHKSSLIRRIDSYRVVGRSVDGHESSVSAYLLRSIEYESKT